MSSPRLPYAGRNYSARTVPGLPSVHVRAISTWITIFPLVTLGFFAIEPFSEGWHPVLHAFVLTLLVAEFFKSVGTSGS